MTQNNVPQLPPLFDALGIDNSKDLWAETLTLAQSKDVEAGNLYWQSHHHKIEIALVLEPDMAEDDTDADGRAKCMQMLHVMMVGLGDALGAVIPPEIAIQYRWPNRLLANGASFGHVKLAAIDDENGNPEFLIVGVHLSLRDDVSDLEPGLREGTTLWDEGCGELNQIYLIEAICRHFQVQLNTWEDEGFGAIHKQWSGRYDDNRALLLAGDIEASFIGLDEMGNGLIKIGKDVTMQALASLDLGSNNNE